MTQDQYELGYERGTIAGVRTLAKGVLAILDGDFDDGLLVGYVRSLIEGQLATCDQLEADMDEQKATGHDTTTRTDGNEVVDAIDRQVLVTAAAALFVGLRPRARAMAAAPEWKAARSILSDAIRRGGKQA